MQLLSILIAAAAAAEKAKPWLPNKSAQWPMFAEIKKGDTIGKFLARAASDAEMFKVTGEFSLSGYSPQAGGPLEEALRLLNADVTENGYSAGATGKSLSTAIDVTVSRSDLAIPSPKDAVGMRAHESYTLALSGAGKLSVTAETEYGARHALTTIANLLESRGFRDLHVTQGSNTPMYMPFNAFELSDFPRLPYRGLMIDTSRTFIPKEQLKRVLTNMGRAKMNVFHWHATDDQSFPLCMGSSCATIHGPDCTPDKRDCAAAYNYASIYFEDDIVEIVEHARKNGVQVVLEIDSPSHARSWGAYDTRGAFDLAGFETAGDPTDAAFADKLIACFGANYQGNAYCAEPVCGPLNLLRNYKNVALLAQTIFSDYKTLMASKGLESHLFHIGMDEIFPNCFGLEETERVSVDWIKDMTTFVNELNMTPVAWDDTFKHYPGKHDAGSIPQVWVYDAEKTPAVVKEHDYFLWSRYEYMYLDCGRGNPAIAGWASWCRPWKSWFDLYKQSPDFLTFDGVSAEEVKAKAIGGSACMWGEQVTEENIGALIWPRAAAWGGAAWEPRTEAIVEADDDLVVIHPMYNDGVGFDYSSVASDHFEAENQLHNWVYKLGRNGEVFTPEQSGYCQRNTVEGEYLCRLYAKDTYEVVETSPTTPPPNKSTSMVVTTAVAAAAALLL